MQDMMRDFLVAIVFLVGTVLLLGGCLYHDKLLSAATEAFAEEGQDVALEAIAARAGVGIGTLYRHFPSREALVVAAYRHEVDALSRAAAELLERLPADEALRAWAERFADYVAT